MSHADAPRTFAQYGAALDERVRQIEIRVAELAANSPSGRRAVGVAARTPGLSAVAGRVERRIRRTEMARTAVHVAAIGVAVALVAAAAIHIPRNDRAA
jgi:hypothetical protein